MCAAGYYMGVSDFDPAEHPTLQDAYDADERQGTLDVIGKTPALSAFGANDIKRAFDAVDVM